MAITLVPYTLAVVRNRNADGGAFRVAGTASNIGTPNVPVRRRVRLHDQITGRVLREVWSDGTTGAYSFDWIRPGTYYVTGFDHTRQYNGVIETDIKAEPMP